MFLNNNNNNNNDDNDDDDDDENNTRQLASDLLEINLCIGDRQQTLNIVGCCSVGIEINTT